MPLIAVLACASGMCLSYWLNRTISSPRHLRLHGAPLSRVQSLRWVLLIWADATCLGLLVVVAPSHWWASLGSWLVVNYICTIIFVISRKRSALRSNGGE
jgi:hypothetical protein